MATFDRVKAQEVLDRGKVPYWDEVPVRESKAKGNNAVSGLWDVLHWFTFWWLISDLLGLGDE